MIGDSQLRMPSELPLGYLAIPLGEAGSSPVRLAALVRREPDDLGGRLVTLRDTFEAQVHLGCVLDSASHVIQWVELWVQTLNGAAGAAGVAMDAVSNHVLDRRWALVFGALRANDPDSIICTGWETAHPAPMVLDLPSSRAVNLSDAQSGDQWKLCEDDALLESCGLPRYSVSAARYLHLPELGAQSPFAVVTDGAPTSAATISLKKVIPSGETVALNPGGGLMMVRAFSPIEAEQFIDVLSGEPWGGLRHGRALLKWAARKDASGDASGLVSSSGAMFLDRHGRWGRLVESLHLKLRLLTDAIAAVRAVTAHTQAPLLNLSAASFQVRLSESGAGLPHLWTARTTLHDPGDAVTLPIAGSQSQHYTRGGAAQVSIYQPETASQPTAGTASVRIRQILNEGGGWIVEGTMTTQQRIGAARNDLLWLRLNLGGQRVDLHSRLDADAALASGEVRFRTLPQRFDDPTAKSLRAAEGVPLGSVSFQVVPLLSAPCDLYSLAVLAVRTLLVNHENSLPKALDEALSLARQVAQEHDETVGLGLRIASLFDRDERWAKSLGPQRLSRESMEPSEAFDLIPADLWWEVLGLIIQMLPGVGPDSFCADLGDAPAGALQRAFDPALAAMDQLLVRTRSLIVIDWRFNREVSAVIRAYSTGLVGERVKQ